jgi:hypothetical protein
VTDGERYKSFTPETVDGLRMLLTNKANVIAGFNNHAYDDVILRRMARFPSPTPEEIYTLSDMLINDTGDVRRLAYGPVPWNYSIDVFQLLDGKGSLKEWGCRERLGNALECPVPFDEPIADVHREQVITYCKNDVAITVGLLTKHWGKVELRHTLSTMFNLGLNVYAMSGQKIAQTAFLAMHRARTGDSTGVTMEAMHANPDNALREIALPKLISPRVAFSNPSFVEMFEDVKNGFVYGDEPGTSWKLVLPRTANNIFCVAGVQFQLGVGGLHTLDCARVFTASDTHAIIDLDVTSYYPSIIINECLSPSQMGSGFAKDMAELKRMRVEAKHNNQVLVADALKLVLNSTFGKLNDMYSPLRSIPDALRVTLNGQLFLLMLAERLIGCGAEVLSANTDGITVRVSRNIDIAPVVKEWESVTGLELERADYVKYCRRDVNNYIAVTTKGKIKRKGALSPDTGKGDGYVVKRAVEEVLLHGRSSYEIVRAFAYGNEQLDIKADPGAFTYYMRAKNGGSFLYGEEPVGKLVRWYVGKKGVPLIRQNASGTLTKVANGGAAVLCLKSLDFNPDNIDLQAYVQNVDALVSAIDTHPPGGTLLS